MQVAPIKPTLKTPGTKRLRLRCDEPLSDFAFNFNLRRYTQVFFHRYYATKTDKVAGAYTRQHFSST